MKIYITIPKGAIRDTFVTEKAMLALTKCGEVICNPYDRNLEPMELCEIVTDVDVLVTGWGTTMLSETILSNANSLKIVAHTGGSIGNLVDEFAYNRGIKVLSGNDIYAKSVAEGCLGYTISALRKTEKYISIVRDGGWREDSFKNKGLIGKRVGLVGFGAIAKCFVELLHMFDTEILVYSEHLSQEDADKYRIKVAPIETIFETCDVISIHSALTSKTEGMINKTLLSKIKQGALLVNTARGAIINEPEMIKELQTGRFLAVLDVFVGEPLALDNPLRTLPNVLPIPHMGGPTSDMREEVVLSLARDIQRYICGQELLNQIPMVHALRMTRH